MASDQIASNEVLVTKDLPVRASLRSIRWWPAALLVISMVVLRFIPSFMDSPSLPMFMAAFMGPAALAGVIMLWLLVASRATWKEKLIGFLAIAVLGFLTILLSDKSMRDMNLMFYILPTGIGVFAVAMTLLANRPNLRVPIAVLAAAIGFGSWTLVRSEGVSGKFDPSFAWRWNPSAEEKFKAQIQQSSVSPTEIAKGDYRPVTLASSQWPAFRGKDRDGKLQGVSIAEDWSSTPPKLLWKISVGPGWGSFSAANDLLFTQEQRGDKEAVVCLNANTGERLWIHEYASRFEESVAGAGPRATPTIADEGLFTLGANGILLCLDANTGKKVWERDLQQDADRKPPMWGFSSSPLVIDGVVIVHAGGKDDKGLLAYDVKTGEPRWSIASGDHSYSSAQRATFDGVSGALMETNSGLQFVNPKDGSKIWQFDAITPNYRTLQPLVIGDSVLLATSLGNGTQQIKVERDGDQWKLSEVWSSRDMKPDFNDFVEQDGNLYGFDGNIFACVSMADGKRKWKKGRYGNGQVLLLSDAGQLLVTSEQGELVLLKVDPTKMIELARFPAISGKTWNHSVVIGDKVYLRNGEEAACYKLPAIGLVRG